jgi:hypothetical protein
VVCASSVTQKAFSFESQIHRALGPPKFGFGGGQQQSIEKSLSSTTSPHQSIHNHPMCVQSTPQIQFDLI